MPDLQAWYLYMIRCDDGSVYTGVSTNVARRFGEHLRGSARAARYLRTRKPIGVIFEQRIGDRSAALAAEYAVKRLGKSQKERLASGATTLHALLAQYATRRR